MKRLLLATLVFGLAATALFVWKSGRDAALPHPDTAGKSDRPDAKKHKRPAPAAPEPEQPAEYLDQAKEIFGSDEKHIPAKILALHRQPVSSEAQKNLLAYLDNRDADAQIVYKNDCIEFLARKAGQPGHVAQALDALIDNPHRDPVLREYALQYLPDLIVTGLGQDDETPLNLLLPLLRRQTRIYQDGIAGTALLQLEQLAAAVSGLPAAEVAETALAILNDHAANDPARCAACQVLSRAKPVYASEARELLLAPQKSLPTTLASLLACQNLGILSPQECQARASAAFALMGLTQVQAQH